MFFVEKTNNKILIILGTQTFEVQKTIKTNFRYKKTSNITATGFKFGADGGT